jgi:hypothetical protein
MHRVQPDAWLRRPEHFFPDRNGIITILNSSYLLLISTFAQCSLLYDGMLRDGRP